MVTAQCGVNRAVLINSTAASTFGFAAFVEQGRAQ